MNNSEKIMLIYEVISRKELSFGCMFLSYPGDIIARIIGEEYDDEGETGMFVCIDDGENIFRNTEPHHIIGHPVMINRVEYYLGESDYRKVRELLDKEEIIKPVDKWNIKAIEILHLILVGQSV